MDPDINQDPNDADDDVDSCSDDAVLDFSADELVELSLLRGLEIDELAEASLIDSASRFDETLLDTIEISHREINISIHTGPAYPARQLKIEYENVSLPRLAMDALRIECRKVLEEGEKKNNIEAWERRDTHNVFDYHMTALHIATVSDEQVRRYRKSVYQKQVMASETSRPTGEARPVAQGHNPLKNPMVPNIGTDLSTVAVDARASKVLDWLPDEICSLIPEEFRVLHVESVIRADLYSKFLDRQAAMLENLKTLPLDSLRKCIPTKHRCRGETAESMATRLVTPKMTFHGTSNQFVPSIVRHGFLAPGSKHPDTFQPLPVRCGSTYGQGIYSSPSPAFSLSYSGSEAQPTKPDGFWGLKLFVCATIMGRTAQLTRDDEWWLKSEPYAGQTATWGTTRWSTLSSTTRRSCPATSSTSTGARKTQSSSSPSRPTGRTLCPLLLIPEKCTPNSTMSPPLLQVTSSGRRIAKASKYFPYGYGPATGTSFVIEEVGEVDEDEEEYGFYQELRVDETYENNDFWDWDDSEAAEEMAVGGSKLDEYASFRSGYGRTGRG